MTLKGIFTRSETSKVDGNETINKSENPRQDANLSAIEAAGVIKAQAASSVWSQKSTYTTYLIIWLIYFVSTFHLQMVQNLGIYVASSFYGAPLITTASVLAWTIGGVFKLPLAKVLDYIGRPFGFTLIICFEILGLVLFAATKSIETYAAATVFYWLGGSSMVYVLQVVMADVTPLEWRGFAFAFAQSPTLITVFAGPAAAQSFLQSTGWQWAFGTFAILMPFVCTPLLLMIILHERRAKQQGVYTAEKATSARPARSLYALAVDFDVIGMFLLCAGVVLILLPLTLANYRTNRWNSPSIISMLVIGFVLLIAFAFYERFAAKKPFLPFHLLVDRTVLGSCFTVGVLYVSVNCWDQYFIAYLQVVYGLSVRDAGYVTNLFQLGTIFWGMIVGVIIRWIGNVKWIALAAVPLQVLGTGLMIYFRQPNHGVGFIVMCQIFVAFAAGTLVTCAQVAIMAAVGQDHNASALALIALFVAIGGSIGTGVSGAIWSGTLPQALITYLPASARSQAATLYLSLPAALKYPLGSPERTAIIEAYAYTQQYMCIAAVALLPLCFGLVLVWRNENVKKTTTVSETRSEETL